MSMSWRPKGHPSTWWLVLVIPLAASVAFGLWDDATMAAGCSGHRSPPGTVIGLALIGAAGISAGSVAVYMRQRFWVVAVQSILSWLATFIGVVYAFLVVGAQHGCWN
jgi:hypothetical protein